MSTEYIGIQQRLSQYLVQWHTLLDNRFDHTAALSAIDDSEQQIDLAEAQNEADNERLEELGQETSDLAEQLQ